ncbi:MAG TPA: hypothetical protein VHL34_14125 [Rhizomicrobium sp.]|jgi:hypothetical protein|nr:hypothetical protein [Rhizomicrobium sp.]
MGHLVKAAFIATFALSSASHAAAAACDRWSLSGPATIKQWNGITVLLDLRQSGETLEGTAKYFSRGLYQNDPNAEIEVNGQLQDGSVSGNRVSFRVSWVSAPCSVTACTTVAGEPYARWRSTGVYEGTIDEDGRLTGRNFDLRDPNSRVKWSMAEHPQCAGAVFVPNGVPLPPPGNTAPAKPIKIVHPNHVSAPLCTSGYVWREARPSDFVCVTPEARSLAANENSAADSRRDTNGAYGPNTCITGFVWREAFAGDVVCTTPERRTAVQSENNLGPSRSKN